MHNKFEKLKSGEILEGPSAFGHIGSSITIKNLFLSCNRAFSIAFYKYFLEHYKSMNFIVRFINTYKGPKLNSQ